MNRVTKALRYQVAALLVAAGLLSSGTAWAFGDTCITTPVSNKCSTLAIDPNPSSHTLNMKIHSPLTTYQLKDHGNGVTIRQGRTGFGWHYETIGGLFNTQQGYVLSCSSAAAWCELNNN